ncbi:ABC transporter ATP-binding protein [Paenibacillus thiaminolyticus]|uniref:ABC transporter ATP-binding protein n=1 Tax=Paenibacillus thiaminolyticus TaxID=49283 RepID=A0AAP9DYG8_PANTH|nr:ABC transporter ATP-binding protein [Paenibacillus thiaminolyticus]MCY9536255.1 ABC transporter ATP-binding protein [Paenibacillus thiaminolyticus]MCY9603481.1 ABC transporter ATP-binding protein [Paenibacillus thiaminolyticus]MCY9605615.1 ABC transporter ATP-binding protein [Paenibacillus thiaminolyticus]MCY9611885.1 ABC transporter ATP-binding protein [Paenibacillus thiaminolyticus]MCY9620917.1 ABC transporter ATP-binding protein [Paenibacillus thiaminolyticus]
MSKPDQALLDVRGLKKYFYTAKGLFGKNKQTLKAVDDVSFQIRRGETFGLVGESGCGKSTTGRSIVRLYDVTAGEIRFDGTDLAHLSERELKPFRKRMQTIFQDPYSSLNPGMNVTQLISEPMEIHGFGTKDERRETVLELLNKVGLKPEHAERYPHEFSGGQRQRISIARALSVKPEFILCDEPISALDVSVQAQVVNMLEDLQAEFGLTYLFIAHDLSMVRHISDRIGVMYLGKLVELAPSDELYNHPAHPYTQALLAAIPVPDPNAASGAGTMLEGDLPSPLAGSAGCRFASRCPFATDRCRQQEPEWKEISPGHFAACHLYEEK